MTVSFSQDFAAYRELCYPHRSRFSAFVRCLIAHPAMLAVIWFRFGAAVWRWSQPLRLISALVYWPGFVQLRRAGHALDDHCRGKVLRGRLREAG